MPDNRVNSCVEGAVLTFQHHCCPTNFVQYSCNLVLKGLIWAPLLLPGEGRDEGVKNQSIGFSDPLTPTLSLRERAFMGQQ